VVPAWELVAVSLLAVVAGPSDDEPDEAATGPAFVGGPDSCPDRGPPTSPGTCEEGDCGALAVGSGAGGCGAAPAVVAVVAPAVVAVVAPAVVAVVAPAVVAVAAPAVVAVVAPAVVAVVASAEPAGVPDAVPAPLTLFSRAGEPAVGVDGDEVPAAGVGSWAFSTVGAVWALSTVCAGGVVSVPAVAGSGAAGAASALGSAVSATPEGVAATADADPSGATAVGAGAGAGTAAGAALPTTTGVLVATPLAATLVPPEPPPVAL
jgi:hypothetical protein